MAYSKRYAGGFLDGAAGGTPIDSTFLNAVEDALLKLFGVAPVTNGALVWDGAQFTAANKIGNSQIDSAAAISKSKLDFSGANGIVNADIAGAAAIAGSKLNLNNILVQPTHFAAGSKITTSAISGGPPAAPSNGDIWIATGVDTNGTRWMFQYNAGSASAYKWEFIGGPPGIVVQGANLLTTVINTWIATDAVYTISRAGQYSIFLSGHAVLDVSTTTNTFIGARYAGVPSGVADIYTNPHTLGTAGWETQIAVDAGIVTFANPGTLTAETQSTAKTGANYPQIRLVTLRVLPVRVS